MEPFAKEFLHLVVMMTLVRRNKLHRSLLPLIYKTLLASRNKDLLDERHECSDMVKLSFFVTRVRSLNAQVPNPSSRFDV